MGDAPRRRVSVAVWAAWDVPVHFVGEGMSRLLGMLIQGAAESGRVSMHVCVRPLNEAAARAMLSALRASEGEDWSLHVIEDSAAPPPPPPSPLTERLLGMPDGRIGLLLFAAGIAATPALILRALLRPIWRFALRAGVRLGIDALRDPATAAPEIAKGLHGLRLPAFHRLADALDEWSLRRRAERFALAPAAASPAVPREPAPTAGSTVPTSAGPDWQVPTLDPASVDAWVSLMADMVVPAGIPGRRAMILPDAMMLDFGSAWHPADLSDNGFVPEWLKAVRRNVAASASVITFSSHVARRHGVELLGVDPTKVRIVPHAPPDYAPVAPFLAATGRRTAASRLAAADALRRHAAERGWRYLADFPLEHVDYIAVSTQERPSKNLPLAIEALRILVDRRAAVQKLLMTAVSYDDPATPFLRSGQLIRRYGLGADAISVPRLPEAVHAAFYHAAAITVHPAAFEGGDAPFPFAESVSVGTPCLMARGPHTEELLERFPSLEPFVFDPSDAERLAALIEDCVARREDVLEMQQAVYRKMRERRWLEVAEEYVAAATDLPLVPVRRLARETA